MAGPPPGFEGFLQQKYDIQRQEANARSNLENEQAKTLAPATASENALRAAQANETNTRASTLQPLANASIAQTGANIGEAGARTGLYNTEAQVQGLDLYPVNDLIAHTFHSGMTTGNSAYAPSSQPAGSATPSFGSPAPASGGVSRSGSFGNVLSLPSIDAGSPLASSNGQIQLQGGNQARKPLGYETGTTKVPGKAPAKGNTDTVPAMLTPGEAVLNVGAAEHVGRDNIEKANQIGLAKMKGKGMPAPKAKGKPAQPVQQHAKGTNKVQPSSFYVKKDETPLKPQTLAKGTHTVMPGKSPGTKTPPKGLARALAAMQSMGGGGAPMMPPAPGGMPPAPGKGMV